MPRRGAKRGARALRWSVDLSPAELAYVEQARAAYRRSRAAFVLAMVSDFERRLTVEVPELTQARAVLEAEDALLEEEDSDAMRDQYSRGGRRPLPRHLGLDEVAALHAAARRRPQSATRLVELVHEMAPCEDDDGQ